MAKPLTLVCTKYLENQASHEFAVIYFFVPCDPIYLSAFHNTVGTFHPLQDILDPH